MDHPCTATCGLFAIRMKTRKKRNNNRLNDVNCKGPVMKIESCNHQKCPGKEDISIK